MSHISLSPAELESIITKISSFKQNFETDIKKIKSYSEGLSQSWKDPQYPIFKGEINSFYNVCHNQIETLHRLESNLRSLKKQSEEAIKIAKQFGR